MSAIWPTEFQINDVPVGPNKYVQWVVDFEWE